eukprot:Phypoly_transcript_10002.p1 GENE.Phypoly_transcript_10002~~Phypoly_transcript_10002.p1  ORF type:complete len:363 (+),score=31.54 Phypoly_transcript_10002:115-1203(+)
MKKGKTREIVSVVAGEDTKPIGEDFPFFGRRTTSRRGCGLTICLTLLVLCAAATVVVMSIYIANREQISAELLLDIGSVAADFAIWDPYTQILFFVDRELNQLNFYDPALNITNSMQFNHTIGIVMPRLEYNDSVIITSENYVASLNLTTGDQEILAYYTNQTSSNATFTDARCDPSGGLWMGAANGDLVPDGTLYRVDATQTVTAMLHNISTPGGMAWSHDKKTFFLIDAKNSRVNMYTYTPQTNLVYEQIAFIVPPQFGTLSGMAIDSTDSLWVAIIGPPQVSPSQPSFGRVCRYDPFLGQLQETIQIPVSQVTSCVFGGPNMDQLYITTRLKPNEPNSGGVYVAKRLGVTGAFPSLYGG